MKTLTTNIAKLFTRNITKNIVKTISVAFLLGTASLVHAGTAVVTVTDNYLYESLIQAEFDIEHQVHTSVDLSSTETFQQALMAANASDNDQLQFVQTQLWQAEQTQIDKSQVEKGIAE